MSSSTRTERLTGLLRKELLERILFLDGATGTSIQGLNLSAADYGGDELEGCHEKLNLSRPDLIGKVHDSYIQSGCDILEANTFGASRIVLKDYGLSSEVSRINEQAVKIALESARRVNRRGHRAYVAGVLGPSTKSLSLSRDVGFDEMVDAYIEQASVLWRTGVDFLLIETAQDGRNIKAALVAIEKLSTELHEEITAAVSLTLEPSGALLSGQSVEAVVAALKHYPLLYLGVNCSTGPEFMTETVRTLARLSPFPVACVPNAGLPDENGKYLETPALVAETLKRFAEQGWINLLGGCCGTTPEHIAAMIGRAYKLKPRTLPSGSDSVLSEIDVLEITDEVRPVMVGERTNVIGSRKFKRLISEEKFDEACEVARAQVRSGAQVVDICLSNPERDECEDMISFLTALSSSLRVPRMIDTMDDRVVEEALKFSQGRSIINSINLEEGSRRFDKVIPLAKRYGAALVVGLIDQKGMGISFERKLEIAAASYRILKEQHQFPDEEIYWDTLVFPCGSKDPQVQGAQKATLDAIRELKKLYPRTKSVLGISNVSFGLPESGREVLNSVYLYRAVQAGLDLAIVNAEKLKRYASLPENEKLLAENLLFTPHPEAMSAFVAYFGQKKETVTAPRETMSVEDRLCLQIREGSRQLLVENLTEALKKQTPLEIINGPLMRGMQEVGKLFNQNQLIVAEVLQSAEVMRQAVDFLKPQIGAAGNPAFGKMLLATVKGDVHDIGKNLVDIIFSNNGFEVINLGIKVGSDRIIQAVHEHQPDLLGLSGLLVKSAHQMAATAADLKQSRIRIPMLCGGAALTQKFVDQKIASQYEGPVVYAQDAMAGLSLAQDLIRKGQESRKSSPGPAVEVDRISIAISSGTKRSSRVEPLREFPKPSDYDRHVLRTVPIDQIWSYINPLMLYGRHLGIPGAVVRQLLNHQCEDQRFLSIWQTVEEVKARYRTSPMMEANAVFQFFEAYSEGNHIILQESGRELHFPRQSEKDGLCLADYLVPKGSGDHLALFAVSVGRGLREEAERLKAKGDYLRSHALQALALESAEGLAELLHEQIRRIWGFPDPIEMSMQDKFQARYRGKRFSFGYPACPKLDDQRILFELLRPEEIGIELTETMMMDPEASVTAMVFHHPGATYFSAGILEGHSR